MIENTMDFSESLSEESLAFAIASDESESMTLWLLMMFLTCGLYALFTWVFRGFRREIPNHAKVKTYEQAWAQICKDYPEWTSTDVYLTPEQHQAINITLKA